MSKVSQMQILLRNSNLEAVNRDFIDNSGLQIKIAELI